LAIFVIFSLSICSFLRCFLFVLSWFLFESDVYSPYYNPMLSHILPAFLLILLLSPILLSSYYSSVFLPLFLCTAKRAVWVQGSFYFVTVCGPTVTSSQSGHRHLIALLQLLSVILPTRVLFSLFHCIHPIFPPYLSAAPHYRLNPSALVL
jgi:hypothetical protein